MGVIHGRDLLSTKWPTAIIIDSVGAAHFFPIKNPIGDFFFAVINNEIYAFNTRHQPFSWRQSMARTFSFYVYFTDNYNPVTQELKELDSILERNDIRKFSMLWYKAMKLFARSEKRKFEAMEKVTLIEALSKEKEKNPKRFADHEELIQFLKDQPLDKILTPVRRATDFLDETFLAPDPAIFGAIKTSLKMLLNENREVNHVEIKAKKGWMKIILMMMVVVMGVVIAWFVYDGGYLDNIGSQFGASFGAISDQELQSRYPQCHQLVSAVDSGAVKLDQISKTGQSIYDTCPRAVSP